MSKASPSERVGGLEFSSSDLVSDTKKRVLGQASLFASLALYGNAIDYERSKYSGSGSLKSNSDLLLRVNHDSLGAVCEATWDRMIAAFCDLNQDLGWNLSRWLAPTRILCSGHMTSVYQHFIGWFFVQTRSELSLLTKWAWDRFLDYYAVLEGSADSLVQDLIGIRKSMGSRRVGYSCTAMGLAVKANKW